jgi:hypothetical protein
MFMGSIVLVQSMLWHVELRRTEKVVSARPGCAVCDHSSIHGRRTRPLLVADAQSSAADQESVADEPPRSDDLFQLEVGHAGVEVLWVLRLLVPTIVPAVINSKLLADSGTRC